MAAMSRTGTKRLELKNSSFELVLERGEGVCLPMEPTRPILDEHPFPPLLHHPNEPLPKAELAPAKQLPPSQESASFLYIKSPMVGTCYLTASPDTPPFVKVGDRVQANQIVCIVEAMKVMNEIKANATGTIAEILVQPGQPVEFGTKLFRLVETN